MKAAMLCRKDQNGGVVFLALVTHHPEWSQQDHLADWNHAHKGDLRADTVLIKDVQSPSTTRPPLSHIPPGMPFQFNGKGTIYIALNGFQYSYTSNVHPLTARPGCVAVAVKTMLHSCSFAGLDHCDLDDIARKVCRRERHKYTSGDRALVRHEFAKQRYLWPKGLTYAA
jgi:hypothetical protein